MGEKLVEEEFMGEQLVEEEFMGEKLVGLAIPHSRLQSR